jgi:hypothetical protein
METSSNKQPIPQNITYTADEEDDKETTFVWADDIPDDSTPTKHMEISPEAPSSPENERPTIPQQVHASKQQEVGLTHQQGSHNHHKNDRGRNTEPASNNVEKNRAETSDSDSLRGKKKKTET